MKQPTFTSSENQAAFHAPPWNGDAEGDLFAVQNVSYPKA